MHIGIDLGGTKIEGIALSEEGKSLARQRIASPQGNYANTIKAVADLVKSLEDETRATGSVGVGMPGALSPASGLIKNANSTWLNGKPFDVDLSRALARPVRLANDANCFTISEAVDGAAANAHSVFGVILGTGCGGGIVIDRRILTGPHAIAGEWGHNPLPWPTEDERPGPSCFCGKQGCIETWLSGPGLSKDFARRTGEQRSAQAIVALAKEKDTHGLAAMEAYYDRLARALAAVINILDPNVIVLGGGLSNIEALYEEVPKRLALHVFSDTVTTPIVKNKHGDASGVRGAAWLWP